MAKYIINSGGVCQQIRDEDWQRIQEHPEQFRSPHNRPDSRLATDAEIAAYWDAQGFIYDPKTGAATPKSA